MELTLISSGPRVFESAELEADPMALDRLARGTADADLAAPPVVLPDFHHKTKLEMPSSIAVATRSSVRPTLTSSSVNCGMTLLTLDVQRPGPEAITEFYRRVRERFPYPKTNRRDLTRREVEEAAARGGLFAAERYGVDHRELERVEEQGYIDLEPYGGAARLRKELPGLAFQLARIRFGSIGPSNHFVELQQVEEVFEPETAALLGIKPGQVTLQYHAGGGVLAGEIGRMFGRRISYPKHLKAAMAIQKPLMHLASARSMAQLKERWSLYFTDGCPPVDRWSEEGQRILLANAAAMNYAFAFRMATFAGLREIAMEVFGGAPAQLVVDSPHNSIYEEEVEGGEKAIVHRHNSCRAYPAHKMPAGTTFARTGQAVLVPGTHRTSSYVGVAGDSAHRSLYSACHGAGTVIKKFEQEGRSATDPRDLSTLRFRYTDEAPTVVPHLDDAGVDAAMDILRDNELVRPVARLRPMAVLH